MTVLPTATIRLLPALTLLLMMLLAVPAGAEYYYRYIDDSGNIHFTDNPGNVPEDKRSSMEEHRGVPSKTPGAGRQIGQRRDSDLHRIVPSSSTWEQNLKQKATSLDQERKALQKQYEEILKKHKELGESSSNLSEKTRYEEQVEALNRRIDSYERQRKQFDEKVSSFRTGSLD